jgi:transcriptional regulator with XRE-family HTH domain
MKTLLERFKNRKFRQAFATETVDRRVAHRIRSIREEQEKSQDEVATELETSQSVVSRYENPGYGKYSYRALQALAKVFDVVLWVDFISHAEFLRRIKGEDAWGTVEGFDSGSVVPVVAAVSVGGSVVRLDDFRKKLDVFSGDIATDDPPQIPNDVASYGSPSGGNATIERMTA